MLQTAQREADVADGDDGRSSPRSLACPRRMNTLSVSVRGLDVAGELVPDAQRNVAPIPACVTASGSIGAQ